MEIADIYENIKVDPLKVTEEELWDVFEKLRSLTLQVFDMNERSLLAASDATKGFLE